MLILFTLYLVLVFKSHRIDLIYKLCKLHDELAICYFRFTAGRRIYMEPFNNPAGRLYVFLMLVVANILYWLCERCIKTINKRSELYTIPSVSRNVHLSSSLRRQLERDQMKQTPPPTYSFSQNDHVQQI